MDTILQGDCFRKNCMFCSRDKIDQKQELDVVGMSVSGTPPLCQWKHEAITALITSNYYNARLGIIDSCYNLTEHKTSVLYAELPCGTLLCLSSSYKRYLMEMEDGNRMSRCYHGPAPLFPP